MAATIFLGQTVRGIVNLRTLDPATGAINPYVIQTGAVINLNFPGASTTTPGTQGSSVVLSTANSGEIGIITANGAQISFAMPPAKSLLLFVTKTAAVDCVITNTDGSVDIFEAVKVYNIASQANP